MPSRPAKPCAKPGCPALTHERYCPAHKREAQRRYDATRGSGARRGYGSVWFELRERILARDPICTWPEGCNDRSTDVDHVVSRRRGGSDDESNLRGLCHYHHSVKTAKEDHRWGGDAA